MSKTIPSLEDFFKYVDTIKDIDKGKIKKLIDSLPQFMKDCQKLKDELDEFNKKEPVAEDSLLLATTSYDCKLNYATLKIWFYLQSLVDSKKFDDVISQDDVNNLFSYNLWKFNIEWDLFNYFTEDYKCNYSWGKFEKNKYKFKDVSKLPSDTIERINLYKARKKYINEILNDLNKSKYEINNFEFSNTFRTNPFLVRVFWSDKRHYNEIKKKYETMPLMTRVTFFENKILKKNINNVDINIREEYNAWDAGSMMYETCSYTDEYFNKCYENLKLKFDKIEIIKLLIQKIKNDNPNNEDISSLATLFDKIGDSSISREELDIVSSNYSE